MTKETSVWNRYRAVQCSLVNGAIEKTLNLIFYNLWYWPSIRVWIGTGNSGVFCLIHRFSARWQFITYSAQGLCRWIGLLVLTRMQRRLLVRIVNDCAVGGARLGIHREIGKNSGRSFSLITRESSGRSGSVVGGIKIGLRVAIRSPMDGESLRHTDQRIEALIPLCHRPPRSGMV